MADMDGRWHRTHLLSKYNKFTQECSLEVGKAGGDGRINFNSIKVGKWCGNFFVFVFEGESLRNAIVKVSRKCREICLVVDKRHNLWPW